MQQIYHTISQFLGNKTTRFIRSSFFFALLYSTLLYLLVRVFFYEFPFTISEGLELQSKILLVIWVFIIVCKLVFTSIDAAENNIGKIKFNRLVHVRLLKKTFMILLTAVMSIAGKADDAKSGLAAESGNNSMDDSGVETDCMLS